MAAALGVCLVSFWLWTDEPQPPVEARGPQTSGSFREPEALEPAAPGTRKAPGSSDLRRSGGSPAESSRELVRSVLVDTIDARFPQLKLSSDQIEQLADAVLRLRDAQQELASLPVVVENAERLRELRDRVEQAVSDFRYVSGMSPAEFSAQARAGSGIDPTSDPAEDPDEIVSESLPIR